MQDTEKKDTINQNDDFIRDLTDLGLTPIEAKTYLALTKLGAANAKKIFPASKVARQGVYRVMPKLKKRGLAMEIFGKPKMFVAIPLREGFQVLLKSKRLELAELEREAKSFQASLREPL